MELNSQSISALWNGKRSADSPVKLIGIRGGLQPASKPNAIGLSYDDVIIRIIDAKVTYWRASTDPSRYLIQHPINTDGAAFLCPGVHLMGKHLMHGKYWVLGQAEDVHVQRLDKNGRPRMTAAGQIITQFGDFGICIHSGGDAEDTGHSSAGCQIIHNADGYFGAPTWPNFYGPIVDAMDRHGLTTIPYLLTEASGIVVPKFENP